MRFTDQTLRLPGVLVVSVVSFGLSLNWAFGSRGMALEPSEQLRSEALPHLQSVTLFVDSGRGSDITGNGSDRAPFKTITYAAKVAQPYSIIQLAAGIYSTQTGENFPIQLKPNVSLQQGQTTVIQGQIYQSGKLSNSVSSNSPAPQPQQSSGQLPETPGSLNPVVKTGVNFEETNLPADFSDLPDLTPGASPEGPTIQPPSATVPQSPVAMPTAAPPVLVKPPQVGGDTDGQTRLASNVSAASGTQLPSSPSRATLLGFRYRVVVEVVDEAARSRLQFLVPDAFRSSYQGKTVMQVGAYRQQVEVDEMIQRLSSNGFAPIVEPLAVSSAIPVTQPQQTANRVSNQRVNAPLVPVPGAPIPIGNAGNLPPVIVPRSAPQKLDGPPPPLPGSRCWGFAIGW